MGLGSKPEDKLNYARVLMEKLTNLLNKTQLGTPERGHELADMTDTFWPYLPKDFDEALKNVENGSGEIDFQRTWLRRIMTEMDKQDFLTEKLEEG